jgi:hypothetical protein
LIAGSGRIAGASLTGAVTGAEFLTADEGGQAERRR